MDTDTLTALTSLASDLSLSIVLLYLHAKCENRRREISDQHRDDLRDALDHEREENASD